MMQSSQLDTARPDQDGPYSHTTKFLHPTRVSDYPRDKFANSRTTATVRVEEEKRVSAFTNKKHCICPVEKTFRTFFEN